MRIGQFNVPEPLLEAQRSGSLVIFAGAGVSVPLPSDYPNFERLAEEIATGSGLTREDHEPLERFLGRLENQGVQVHRLTRELLTNPSSRPNQLHHDLLKLFDSKSGIRLVTTNFDSHFTTVARELFEGRVAIFDAPALPLGNRFEGVVYLHGSVEQEPEQLVLTDRDFGYAYLTEGWARRFLQAMFAKYTALFVGYSHSDVVMNYLARGLPPDTQGQRYALTHESEPGRWNLIGVSPIIYPLTETPNEHSALGESLGRWVSVARMGVLDHEHKIREITRRPPPLEPEDADYIENALRDPVTVRFFARHARGLEWLRWAESKQEFRELFGSVHPLANVFSTLAHWFAENFACEHPEEALGVIHRRGPQLSPVLWEAIANTVALKLGGVNSPPDPRTVSKWVAVLLSSPYPESSSDLLSFLLSNCRCPEDDLTALLLFEHLTEPRSRLERGLSLPGLPALRQEIELEGEIYSLRESWKRILRPNLAVFAKSLEPILVRHLQRAHLLLRSMGEANDIWDPLTSWRSAIEPHEQDLRDAGVDLLVDATRDTLEWMLEHESGHAQRMIETWIAHQAPLLRRLAVHGITESATLGVDEKIDWMLKKDLLYGYGPKHEVFRLLGSAYPSASEASRLRLLDRACLGPRGEDAQGLEESTRQYETYNMLVWLHQVAPDCPMTTRRFEEVQQMHEGEFEPREYPDLYSYTTRLAPTGSPVTVDELLVKDPVEVIDWLLSYQEGDRAERVTGGRLLETASQAVAQSYPWGQRLTAVLRDREIWDSDLWKSVIEGWRDGNLTKEQWKEVLDFLTEHAELYSFAHEIADLLQKNASEDGDGTIPSSCLSIAEALAERLWETLQAPPPDVKSNDTEGWLFKAINHPGGKLTGLWLLILSRKRAEADGDWRGLPSEYQRYFDKVLSRTSYAAELGRVILTSELLFLFSSDADWTRRSVLPLLGWSVDTRRAEQAWHGFLSRGRWSEALLPDLLPLYEGTFAHVQDLPQRLRSQFSKHLASIAVYGSSNPIWEGWLGRFLLAVEPKDRGDWASAVGFILRQSEEDAIHDLWNRWLGEYWSRRNAGIPSPLEPDELEKMIDWSLHLASVFPEAVVRIRESTLSAIKYSRRFLSQLAESSYASRHPVAVAELLSHLLPRAPHPFRHCQQVATLVRVLVQHASVPRATLDQICNELGRLGCPDAAELRKLLK